MYVAEVLGPIETTSIPWRRAYYIGQNGVKSECGIERTMRDDNNLKIAALRELLFID
jgi:hypothetical protein